MKTRTDGELNRVIAEWMGWNVSDDGFGFQHQPPTGSMVARCASFDWAWLHIPNYCADLNAIHEAENQIFELQQSWEDYVRHITDTCVEPTDALHATARQRAEALVRVIEGEE